MLDLADAPSASAERTYFLPNERDAIRRYYEEQGYVVVRGLVPAATLDHANRCFDEEVRPSNQFIYRQTTANPERHRFTAQGFMLNPILNVQSLDPRRFARFRAAGEAVLTDPALHAVLAAILAEPGKLVQSMYFEGNPATWAHQDTYYLDAEKIGAMAAVWIAAEDIAPGAGRFYVYPGSHRIDIHRNGGHFDVAFNHDRYKTLVTQIIRDDRLECRAPALKKGDVLIWHSKTIHGSLSTSEPARSRRSFTGHYIPDSMRLLQLQSRIKPHRFEAVNGVLLTRPKDQGRWASRSVMAVETRFPNAFRMLKRVAVKLLTAR